MASTLVASLLGLAALLTSFISGVLGMAGGMILMGVLLALVPVSSAMLLHGVTQLASNGWRAWLWRHEVDGRVLRGYVLGALVVLAVFASLQWVISKPLAYLLLGAMPFVGIALPERLALNVQRPGHPAACGVVCMAMQLTGGVAGPLLDVFFVRADLGRKQVVATKALTQSFSHAVKIVYFSGIAATASAQDVPLAALMVALAFVGTSLSRSLLERLADASFRAWTRWTVMAVGVVYLVSGAILLMR